MDFLELFNRLARLAKPAVADELVPITDLDAPLKDTGIDSLDMLMITVYTCEIFGIPEEVGKNLKPANVAEVKSFVEQHKTRDFGTLEEALAAIT